MMFSWLPRCNGKIFTAHKINIYRAACEYMALTEIYDRSLTPMRSKYDSTAAQFKCSAEAVMSNRYANEVRSNVCEKYRITAFELYEEIGRHGAYTAQMWIDEYERLQGGEQAE